MSGRFLDFSLAFYARPGVADSCLALQDRDGADVNLLLFALWHAAEGWHLTRADLIAADQAATFWREQVVKPLRTVRRALPKLSGSADADALRDLVKTAELKAEFLEQDAMERTTPSRKSGQLDPSAALANLELYAALHGKLLDPTAVGVLLNAFSDRAA